MPSLGENNSGRAYWRSLDELADTPEFRRFVESEFPSMASWLSKSPSRRQFLKLMGASMALAGLAGCRWPQEKLVPAASQPAGRVPGKTVQYATAMELGGYAQGLLVTCHVGRPIKIEGNPLHPINRGAADAIAQASILEFYDPDRSRQLVQNEFEALRRRVIRQTKDTGKPRQWSDFEAFAKPHFAELRAKQGAGLYILSETTSSPSMIDMRGRLQAAFPQAQWFEYEPISRDNERAGTAMAFGRPYRPHYALDKTDVIVSFDEDLFGTHPAALKHARDFVAGRLVDRHGSRLDNGGEMNRLYVTESGYSITGAMADHRWPSQPGSMAFRTWALGERAVGLQGTPELAFFGQERDSREPVPPRRGPTYYSLDMEVAVHAGRCVVAVGPAAPPEAHAFAHALNVTLGNMGRTVEYTEDVDPTRKSHVAAVEELVRDVRSGKVETLLILGGNPVFDAPADFDFFGHLATVKTSIHLSLCNNETSQACSWHLPRAHYLESWGDARAYDGTISIIQPTIEPLYEGRTPIELLAFISGDKMTKGHDIVRRTFGELFDYGVNRGELWRQSLHDGVVAGTALPTVRPAVDKDRVSALGVAFKPPAEGVFPDSIPTVPFTCTHSIRFAQDNTIYDGRFANNGWLQELPDPLTKLTWDNAALISPAMAKELGVRSGDVLKLTAGERSIEIAAFVQPGQAEKTIVLPLGYGRVAAGRVGDGVGCNTYALRTSQAMDILTDVKVEKTGRRYMLATTQDHQAMDSKVGREATAKRLGELVREADVEHYRTHPDFAKHVVHHPPLKPLWREPVRQPGATAPPAHRWAMAIDLSACIGCGACAVACQAENNIPVVGKEEVEKGREMAWLRIDRYYRGEPEDPQVAFQPLTCHQCENAPCEQVCPVAATVHSAEGLNDMVYNRCIGTRYCSNNCPYKVRRFNWFNNHKEVLEVEKLAFNPEVTLRSRGVMEKCTYCVQRISRVKIVAKNERRPIADGEIVPACGQTCPTQAIVFGDLNDPNSRVAKLQAADRTYALLEELNVRPRTVYLARLRNAL
jgi:molybdopterin-containing oxidoreductase family iron-sulfur binding subunit